MTVRDLKPEQVEAIRARFVTGEDPETIAPDFALTPKQVSQLAYRRKWKADKAKVREILSEKTPEAVAARLVAAAADYVQQHIDDWQALRKAVMDLLEAKWSDLDEEQEAELKGKASVAIGASKLFDAIQKGQRLSLNLDKPQDDKPQEQAKAIVVVPPDSEDWQKLVEKRTKE